MYYAEVDDYFVRDDAVYYHVVGKLDMAPILLHRLNRSETLEEAVARWSTEQHWRIGVITDPLTASAKTVRLRLKSGVLLIIPRCGTKGL